MREETAFSIPSQPLYGDQEGWKGSPELGVYGRRGYRSSRRPGWRRHSWFAPTASEASPWRVPYIQQLFVRRARGLREFSLSFLTLRTSPALSGHNPAEH